MQLAGYLRLLNLLPASVPLSSEDSYGLLRQIRVGCSRSWHGKKSCRLATEWKISFRIGSCHVPLLDDQPTKPKQARSRWGATARRQIARGTMSRLLKWDGTEMDIPHELFLRSMRLTFSHWTKHAAIAAAALLWCRKSELSPKVTKWLLAGSLASYVWRVFASHAGGHRYFAHSSFKTTKWLELAMAMTIQVLRLSTCAPAIACESATRQACAASAEHFQDCRQWSYSGYIYSCIGYTRMRGCRARANARGIWPTPLTCL
jgi:hypothetical protein